MADKSLCITAVDKSSSGRVDGNFESRISNTEIFVVEVMPTWRLTEKEPIIKNWPNT